MTYQYIYIINRNVSLILAVLLVLAVSACGNSKTKSNSSEQILNSELQDLIFDKLNKITNNSIPETVLSDSLAFLIVPIQASCPYCRKNVLKSIIRNKDSLPENHYIVISANGGRKTINSFFREHDEQLPTIKGKLFLDSMNKGQEYGLFDEKPTIYYTYNRKAYIRTASIPVSIKKDLSIFFSNKQLD